MPQPKSKKYPSSEIIPIIMERDGISLEEAEEMLDLAREEASELMEEEEIHSDCLDDIMQSHFGLEPDYVMELI